jgi:NADH:ubiquinone oxidoreductase subunit F (NADH-binding)
MTDILAAPAGWPAILIGRDRATAPGDLDAAVRLGAFEGLKRAVRDLGPTATIATIGAAGLRGRGGAGVATADKWRACAGVDASRRYVVANGYEADPSARTDRTLLAERPFAVIEGAAIAAWAVGASEVIIAVRGEETALVASLEAAVDAAADLGLVGPDALGSGRDLDVSVRGVQGAYLLGEETVLLRALEGRRGQPEQRPPYPAVSGLFGAPTVVHNVATLAALPWILREGPEAFAAIGDRAGPGTVLVHVRGPAGDGVVEAPTGTPIRELVDLVGGVGPGRRLKALVIGGPAGGIVSADALDTPYTFEDLRRIGAHVGSGAILLADERACILDLARVLTRFCASEACGKSIPCRIGTQRLVEIGDRMADGRARPTDPVLLDDLAHDIVESGLCDHERLATLPMTSGMRYFRSEFDEHLERGSCPAGVCQPIAMATEATRPSVVR